MNFGFKNCIYSFEGKLIGIGIDDLEIIDEVQIKTEKMKIHWFKNDSVNIGNRLLNLKVTYIKIID
jgi:hypothetical protein